MTRKIFQIGLGLVASVYVVGGALAIAGLWPGAREANSVWRAYAVFGAMFVVIGLAAGAAVWAAKKRWWTLIVAGVVLCGALPVLLFAAFWVEEEKASVHRRQINDEVDSGRAPFGDNPALFAVAQAIARNDQEAIRTAAKGVPDLQTRGSSGATLLAWTVRRTWQRRELVEAVKTLLSLGADPNYTTGPGEPSAMGYAIHGPAEGLRAMLEAGGNPNALNEYGWPLVFMHYKLGYYQNEEMARLDLLLDRGADIHALVPDKEPKCAGYPLVLYTTHEGWTDPAEYGNAEHLLKRGADPNRVAPDGMTLAKKLTEYRDRYAAEKRTPPAEFRFLWAWAESHGILAQPQ